MCSGNVKRIEDSEKEYANKYTEKIMEMAMCIKLKYHFCSMCIGKKETKQKSVKSLKFWLRLYIEWEDAKC